MRLTLRTILAYLDDVLEPAQAREIGAKLAESKEAAALATRIKDVIRRRRIGAPEISGPGSGPDPNIVADYLENSLPPGQVVEYERLCQNSEIHLAEVAACHKILTMVMGQPVDVADDVRERMEALGVARLPSEALTASDSQPMAEGLESVAGRRPSALPEYMSRQGSWKRMALIGALILAALGWLGLIITDKSLWTAYPQTAMTELPPAANADGQPAPVDAGAGKAGEAAQPAQDPPVDQTPPDNSIPMRELLIPPATPELPNAGLPMDSISGGITAPEFNTDEDLDEMDEAIEDLLDEPRWSYSAGEHLAMIRHDDSEQWDVVTPETFGVLDQDPVTIHVGDDFASPAPFRNETLVENRCRIVLEPNARIGRIERTEAAEFAFVLDRGRVLLERQTPADSPVTIEVVIGSSTWLLILQEPGTRCGLEVILPEPQNPPGGLPTPPLGGGIAVASGQVLIQSADDDAVKSITPSDLFLAWPSAGAVWNAGVAPVPDWMLPGDRFMTPASKQVALTFQKEFQGNGSVADRIAPVIQDRRATISELAVQTMALADRYDLLVPALSADHQETRLAAIRGLRQWLPRHAANDNLLRAEIERVFPDADVTPIRLLLWGFPVESAKNDVFSRQLVDWMKSDSIAIRELAFFYAVQFTGRKYDYLPMAPVAERRAALQRWEDHLKRQAGCLLPN